MKLKAVFLDEDGSLIPDFPHNIDGNKETMNEDFVEGLQLLQSYGYLLILVSNQDGLAHGSLTEKELQNFNSRIKQICSKIGIYIDGFYYCPHHPNGTVSMYASDCECRKPQPGLLLKAACDMDIDLSNSWMIGDVSNDVEAGNRAGCKTIVINKGRETEWVSGYGNKPQFKAKDLAEAARYILTANVSSQQLSVVN